MKRTLFLTLLAGLAAGLAYPLVATGQSLRGSRASLDRQNRVARQNDFTYIANDAQAYRFRERGFLVQIRPNPDFVLHDVSFPMARAEVGVFVERLAGQYRAACGEQLVVTSLTRPKSHQPRNASDRSVHPTGMAVDLRRPNNHTCRSWLQRVLLDLEAKGVLEATLERWPPHFHIAVFPKQYSDYVARLTQQAKLAGDGEVAEFTYVVKNGDTLWKIARDHTTTIEALKQRNYLRTDKIRPGQSLAIPRVAR